MRLFLKTVGQYSASTYEIAQNLLRSRDTQRERAARLERELEAQQQRHAQLQARQRQLEEQLREARRERDQARHADWIWLAEGERGWLSTELLESAFGRYKTIEGQHSKGGFTSLLASFARTSVADTKHWVATKLGKTLASKKLSAYRNPLSPAPDG